MSFWKFKSAFAAPPTDGINTILSSLPTSEPLADSPSSASASPPSPSPANVAAHHSALDSLLAEPDLLSEIKSGTNSRLTDFLARKEVVLRVGGWVVWGLGRGVEPNPPMDGPKDRRESILETGVLPDDLEDGKVPDDVVRAAERERLGMGGVPRRKEVELEDKTGEGDEKSDDEPEDETKWANFPRLCTEILAASAPSLTDILFRHDAASSQPHLCPSPESFLLPFWESVLGSTEQQLALRASQVGYWAKVNGVLLDGPMSGKVLSQILTIPHLLPRLLALLPFCSPINDLLLILLRVSRPPSPLIPSTVTQSIRMLDPFSALGKPGHVAAEELLRGIIELCSAIPRPQAGGPGGLLGGPPQMPDEPAFEWRDTTLARQIADEKSVKTLLDWMLAEVRLDEDDEGTPVDLPDQEEAEMARRRELRTSSLVAAIAVLVDLIRKNNSDFVEQQMLAWARRKEADAAEKELLEADGAEIVRALPLPGRESGEEPEDDKGPSIVDLGGMLSVIAERISGLQALIKKPRSSTAVVKSAAGPLSPLTLERFRICELYAELLHCSNMSLLNRSDRSAHLYDAHGYLARGWQAADDLAQALAGPPSPEDDDQDPSRTPHSPGLTTTRSPYSTSPGDYSFPSSSGISTPSGRESLDEESGGVLTKSEAKELREIVAAAGRSAELEAEEEARDEKEPSQKGATGEKDPSGDPASEDEVVCSDDEAVEMRDRQDESFEDKRRRSIASNVTDERDLPTTPSIYSNSSKQLPQASLAPGPLLKTRFMEHGVVSTMLDLFFDYPWNNFLHNVVFDLLQQIFHGRIDRSLDRQLALSVFLDGRLCERILEGQKRNDAAAAQRTNMRLGYMGHMTLIAEEAVKFFDRYPDEIFAVVESMIPQPDWDNYVSTTLRETRERDLTPLSGGGGLHLPMLEQTHSSGFSDDDDEFPMNSARAMRAMEAGGMAGGAAATDEGAFGGRVEASSTTEVGDSSVTDQFSRYLANAITSDRTDKFGSSDEDDEDDANWLGGSRFDPGDVDFALDAQARPPERFGFDDRFDAAGMAFRSAGGDSDDEVDEWAPFEGAASVSRGSNGFGIDAFTPTVASSSSAAATSGGFETSFSSAFGSDFAPVVSGLGGDAAEDDWGDFEGADSGDSNAGFGTGASITLPPMDDGDFDFGESSRSPSSFPSTSFTPHDSSSASSSAFDFPRGTFGDSLTADPIEDGSSMFGRLSIGSDPGSPEAEEQHRALPPLEVMLAQSEQERAADADRATSPTEPLGPAMHENAHVTDDGMVEAEVEGKTVRVPADDIVLAHRRHSSGGSASGGSSRRSSLEETRPPASSLAPPEKRASISEQSEPSREQTSEDAKGGKDELAGEGEGEGTSGSDE
ncbi:hypothetical protein JCM1841_001862 [Sporobolomyces salmonicolor]